MTARYLDYVAEAFPSADEADFRHIGQDAGIITDNKDMFTVFEHIQSVAESSQPILITGETGTGKELTARAIHQLSNRRDKTLVMVNCPAIPENLLESELFGYKKDAFTGAVQNRDAAEPELREGSTKRASENAQDEGQTENSAGQDLRRSHGPLPEIQGKPPGGHKRCEF